MPIRTLYPGLPELAVDRIVDAACIDAIARDITMKTMSRLANWRDRIAGAIGVVLSEHARGQCASSAAAMHRRSGAALRDLYCEHRARFESAELHSRPSAIPLLRPWLPMRRPPGNGTTAPSSAAPALTGTRSALAFVADDERR